MSAFPSSPACRRFFAFLYAKFLHTGSAVLLLDGGMGTELQARGFTGTLPLWSAGANETHPNWVKDIHRAFIEAGADVCTTNTFRTTAYHYQQTGLSQPAAEAKAKDMTFAAVRSAQAAREESGRDVLIAGSFAPRGDCYTHEIAGTDAELLAHHRQQVAWLKEAGVDFLLAETIPTRREAELMAKAAAESDMPFVVSFTVRPDGKLYDGSSVAAALAHINKENFPNLVGISVNCAPVDDADIALQGVLARRDEVGMVGAYPNATCKGHTHDEAAWDHETHRHDKTFVQAALDWVKQGALFVGGCCGTTPTDIEALAQALGRPKGRAGGLPAGWHGANAG